MSNVIRPDFGRPAVSEAKPAADEYRPLRTYGTAFGHVVALIRADAGPEGLALQVVVGPEAGNTVETVAVLPDTNEGETDAERIGLAILRTLEILADAGN